MSDLDDYWAGYFRADGCISLSSTGKLSASFGQVVIEPVLRFAAYVNKSSSMVRSYTQTHKMPGGKLSSPTTRYVLSCASKGREYFERGIKYGDLGCLSESKHFWRGMIDGDGSLFTNRDGKDVFALCGTESDIRSFALFLDIKLGIKPKVHLHSSKSIYFIQLSSASARVVVRYLYLGEFSALGYKRDVAARMIARPLQVEPDFVVNLLENKERVI